MPLPRPQLRRLLPLPLLLLILLLVAACRVFSSGGAPSSLPPTPPAAAAFTPLPLTQSPTMMPAPSLPAPSAPGNPAPPATASPLQPSQIPTNARSSASPAPPSAAAPPASPSSVAPSPNLPAAAPPASPSSVAPSPNLPAAATPAPSSPQEAFTVKFHPDGGLFVGDQVSIEVISPPGEDMTGRQVQVEFGAGQTAQAQFGSYGIANRRQATFWWVWDTAAARPGEHEITFSILPGGPSWSETLTLAPRQAVPSPEPQAAWMSTESDCCLVHYISGTAAERDLDKLLDALDAQAEQATQRMGVALEEPIQVVFLPRVLGHGGFASDSIYLSYLDRNYAGSNSEIVFHHEIVHILDARLGGDLLPTMLVEGLAVYLSGGHFKDELLLPRAAALLPPSPGCTPVENAAAQDAAVATDATAAAQVTAVATEATTIPDPATAASDPAAQNLCSLGWYLPLTGLVDDFYAAQHEIGYLQAGALIEYMVETWGWDAYLAFYRDIHPQPPAPDDLQDPGGPQYMALDDALRRHFGLTLEELEEGFLAALRRQPLQRANIADVSLQVQYYDTVRAYQQALDPSAYFQTAWLPDGVQMRLRRIVADFVRHPAAPENQALETMLVAASRYIQPAEYARADPAEADYARAAELLAAIQAVLVEIRSKNLSGFPPATPPGASTESSAGAPAAFSTHPLAQQYLELVLAARQAGYDPQRIWLAKNLARVWANAAGPELVELGFYRHALGWELSPAR